MSIARSILSAAAVGGWDIANLAQTGVSFDASSVSPFEDELNGIFFKPDGTLVVGIGSEFDRVFSLSLSTPWNISTASLSTAGGPDYLADPAHDVFLDPTGEKLFTLRTDVGFGVGQISQYALSTPWDVASYTSTSNITVSNDAKGMFFKPDGSAFFVIDFGGIIREYTTGAPWSVSGATLLRFVSPVSVDAATSIFFRKDGRKMYINEESDLREYNLVTPWDISNLSFVQTKSLGLTAPQATFFRPDGKRCFVGESQNGFIYEYSL